MEKSQLIKLLQYPESLNQEVIPELEKLAKRFPYCQAIHILIAKAYKNAEKNYAEKKLNTAALYSSNRKSLKKYINSEIEVVSSGFQETKVKSDSDTQKNRATDLINKFLNQNVSSVELDQVNSLFTHPEKTISYSKEYFEKLQDERLPFSQKNQSQDQELSDKGQISNHTNSLNINTPRTNRDPKKINDIIDKFIKEDPAINPIKPETDTEINDPEDFITNNLEQIKGPVSETFAKLLVKQNKFEKAIEIYKELILKNPEKKIYFASRIEELKKQL